MAWFSSKRKWESLPADEVAAEIKAMKPNDAKEALKRLKDGKVPGLTPKQQKAIQKEYERCYEGEKGLAALRDALKGGGSKNYQNIPLRDRVHPSEYRRILEREAKKQGLL